MNRDKIKMSEHLKYINHIDARKKYYHDHKDKRRKNFNIRVRSDKTKEKLERTKEYARKQHRDRNPLEYHDYWTEEDYYNDGET